MNAQSLIVMLELAGRKASPRKDPQHLCQDVGINRATWQRIKAGKTEPQHATLRGLLRLAQSLDVKVDLYSEEAA